MPEEAPPSEDDLRSDLARVAFRMRHIRDRIAHYNQEWMSLVAERIELTDHLSLFEIEKADHGAIG